MPTALTPPIFLTPRDLQTNSTLTQHLVDLCNEAFSRSSLNNPEKWTYRPASRFPNTQQLLTEFAASESTIAVVLDESDMNQEALVEIPSGNGETRKGRLIACAGVAPWKGGWQSKDPGEEKGWEVKTVCVDKAPMYAKKGLAVELLGTLEEMVVEKEREKLRSLQPEKGPQDNGTRPVISLWITCAECVNGNYWRKRGFKEIRRQTYYGIWGCKTSFEMLDLKRDIEFDL
ncbi:hypothetical protein SLS60_001818 [Paraconiothyrium brasiliense]|uniref:N-acetyltransferase domain-containing protein n=1 Tax=Paraconiothyrium brasiliense TaxID=300254 RepID=A0ABR3S105_9PLEO